MNKKQIIILITVFSVFSLNTLLKAQIKNSVYSMFGIGQLTDNSLGVNKSLGGTGIAFQSGRSINYLNPASYLGILPGSFMMELGVYGIYNRSENKNSYKTDYDINFGYSSIGLYVANWWAASVGIVPFSSVDYEINSSDEIEGELTRFEKKYTGSGGLNRVYLGNSFNIYKGLSIGFNASYIVGTITQTETATGNGSFGGYELKDKHTAHSFYLDYGLQYSLNNINPANKTGFLYTIGVVYGAGKKLITTEALDFTYNGTTSSLNTDKQPGIKIPQKTGVGFSIKGNNFRAGLDYEWKNFANISFSNPNFDTKNSSRLSFGAEYSPGQSKTDESWYKLLLYRVGANYKRSYLEIDNTPINSMGINLGVGIPYDATSSINMSLEYGTEGTLNKGLIKNNYWTFYLNISLHEFWSSKSRHD